jgi:hypothetical protein
MQKYLPTALSILLLWSSSCDHDETKLQQVASEKKITITDLEHEPAVKDLLLKVQGSSANGRISSLEISDAFFKYSEPDSGILNYTFRLPDDSPDYFENLVLSQYEDGFYGFIYRYIPDGPYLAGDSFKGTFQQYNLAGELIREFTLPAAQDSAASGGRTQLINQCVKSIDQTCTTIYEVENRTDYPCHCQYDHKTVVSSVCTFSFNRGWCDDMIAEPPTGGGGTYVGASDAKPRSGGPGGSTGTTTPKPVKKNPVVVVPEPGFDDITFNNVKSPCLVSVIKNLMRKDFKTKINHLAMTNFVEMCIAVNLDFNEAINIKNEKGQISHAATSPVFSVDSEGNTHVTINLNSSTLPGTSELFQIITIYHESIHGIFKVLNTGAYVTDKGESKFKYYREMSTDEQHEVIASTDVVGHIIDAVSDIYGRKLSQTEEAEVAAMVLYGISGVEQTANFKTSLSKWNLDMTKIATIGERNERAVYDANNNLIRIGGKECNNE